jgi:hypothetical protein
VHLHKLNNYLCQELPSLQERSSLVYSSGKEKVEVMEEVNCLEEVVVEANYLEEVVEVNYLEEEAVVVASC